jgi:NhaB family Na+:H+ antiporter
MVIMALPYTVVLALVGLAGIVFFVEPMTAWFYDAGWISAHVGELTPAVSSGH